MCLCSDLVAIHASAILVSCSSLTGSSFCKSAFGRAPARPVVCFLLWLAVLLFLKQFLIVPECLPCIQSHVVQDVAQTPVAESVDLASMPIEDSYDGPHLEGTWHATCSKLLPAVVKPIDIYCSHIPTYESARSCLILVMCIRLSISMAQFYSCDVLPLAVVLSEKHLTVHAITHCNAQLAPCQTL